MTVSPLKKNEFLAQVAGAFLAANPAWSCVQHNKREYACSVGRSVERACFVVLSFSCRPDRYWFGHSVGWSPSLDTWLERSARRETAPLYPRDGSLARLRTLDTPRDFQAAEMSRPTFTLYRPHQSYSLEDTSVEEVRATMLAEVAEQAFPYLCMMLSARHGLELSCAQLGGAQGL
jgi:hypothetical protein